MSTRFKLMVAACEDRTSPPWVILRITVTVQDGDEPLRRFSYESYGDPRVATAAQHLAARFERLADEGSVLVLWPTSATADNAHPIELIEGDSCPVGLVEMGINFLLLHANEKASHHERSDRSDPRDRADRSTDHVRDRPRPNGRTQSAKPSAQAQPKANAAPRVWVDEETRKTLKMGLIFVLVAGFFYAWTHDFKPLSPGYWKTTSYTYHRCGDNWCR